MRWLPLPQCPLVRRTTSRKWASRLNCRDWRASRSSPSSAERAQSPVCNSMAACLFTPTLTRIPPAIHIARQPSQLLSAACQKRSSFHISSIAAHAVPSEQYRKYSLVHPFWVCPIPSYTSDTDYCPCQDAHPTHTLVWRQGPAGSMSRQWRD
jgi:hypothetical protein